MSLVCFLRLMVVLAVLVVAMMVGGFWVVWCGRLVVFLFVVDFSYVCWFCRVWLLSSWFSVFVFD